MSWNSLPLEIQQFILIDTIAPISEEIGWRVSYRTWKRNVAFCILVCREWQSIVISELAKNSPMLLVLEHLSEKISLQAIEERLALLSRGSGTKIDTSLLETEDWPTCSSDPDQDVRDIWLEIVIQRGFESCVKYLLDAGTDINGSSYLRDNNGIQPIENAVQYRRYSIAELLLDRGAKFRHVDIDSFDSAYYNAGASLLWAAARDNRMSLAIKVLDHDFPINEPENKPQTPLCEALAKNHIDMAKFLLDRGASLMNGNEETYETPLYVAARSCSLDTVSMLVERGADVNLGCTNGTPLEAAIRNSESVARFLVSKGAEVTEYDLRLCVRSFPTTSVAFVEFLAGKVEDSNNNTAGAMHLALTAAIEEEQEKLIKILLDKGVKPGYLNLRIVSKGNVHITELLLEAGADPNIVSDKGNSLYRAASIGSVELVELLLKHGVPINAISGKHNRALMVAAYHGYADVVKVLLSRGAESVVDDGENCWGSAFEAAKEAGQSHILYMFDEYDGFGMPEVEPPPIVRSSSTEPIVECINNLF